MCSRCLLALLLTLYSLLARASEPADLRAAGFAWGGKASPREVTVFTAGALRPMAHLEAATRVYVLAPLDGVLDPLRFANPGSEAAARVQSTALLNSPAGQQALATLRRRANAAALAWLLGIDRLPAVLVSPGYVVYGVYDVHEALQWIEEHRDAHEHRDE
ncbi:MAG: DUF1525 domain-containing protein [Parahaliea sp.]